MAPIDPSFTELFSYSQTLFLWEPFCRGVGGDGIELIGVFENPKQENIIFLIFVYQTVKMTFQKFKVS